MELTGENMAFLVRAVRMGGYAARARVEHMEPVYKDADGNRRGHIRFQRSRRCLWTTYKSGGKTKTLSKKVSSCSDEELSTRIKEREAAKLERRRQNLQMTSSVHDDITTTDNGDPMWPSLVA